MGSLMASSANSSVDWFRNTVNQPKLNSLLRLLKRSLRSSFRRMPALRSVAVATVGASELVRHAAGRTFPSIIQPNTRFLSLAITANCNARCLGCRYGRDFMPAKALSLPVVRDVIDDASSIGVTSIRFYGGEPLVHQDLASMIAYATDKGINCWISTNAILLDARRFEELRGAGLRTITVGLYGVGDHYDEYVQKKGTFQRVEYNLRRLRSGLSKEVDLHLQWLLTGPSCSVESLHAAWNFAVEVDAKFHVDLVHEDNSLPYFIDGPDGCLKLSRTKPEALLAVVAELIKLRRDHPGRYSETLASIRSIPEWVYSRKEIDVPCDMYKHLWIGPDGSVKLCYPDFPLGNINATRLRDLVYTKAHREAAQSAFKLRCSGCNCNRDTRVARDWKTQVRYGWVETEV